MQTQKKILYSSRIEKNLLNIICVVYVFYWNGKPIHTYIILTGRRTWVRRSQIHWRFFDDFRTNRTIYLNVIDFYQYNGRSSYRYFNLTLYTVENKTRDVYNNNLTKSAVLYYFRETLGVHRLITLKDILDVAEFRIIFARHNAWTW